MSATAANAGSQPSPARMLHDRMLHDRVMLVAGALGGLGKAASLACARAGATVVLLGRRVPKLNRLHDAITADGGEAVLYPLDMEGASPDDYAEMAAKIESEFGRLDGVLHCAAEFKGLTPLSHTDPADFARALHIGLTAKWWLTQACLPLLARSGDGSVVFVLDDLARTGNAYWGGYGLSQHALAAMIAMLQAEQGERGVRISGLQPGPMRTALRGRAFLVEEDTQARDPAVYADTCVEMLSPAGSDWRGLVRDMSSSESPVPNPESRPQ